MLLLDHLHLGLHCLDGLSHNDGRIDLSHPRRIAGAYIVAITSCEEQEWRLFVCTPAPGFAAAGTPPVLPRQRQGATRPLGVVRSSPWLDRGHGTCYEGSSRMCEAEYTYHPASQACAWVSGFSCVRRCRSWKTRSFPTTGQSHFTIRTG